MGKQDKHQIRIIAGQWRGRRLPVLDMQSLRPSKDLVRETLFNWLQASMHGSRCLDAFAGSGALGFEAASRGAAEVVMLEKSQTIVAELRAAKTTLDARQVNIQLANTMQYLTQPADPFDIVFLDPPFGANLLAPCCQLIAEGGWLRNGGCVYLEAARKEGLPELPDQWHWLREKRSGDVVYGLAASNRALA